MSTSAPAEPAPGAAAAAPDFPHAPEAAAVGAPPPANAIAACCANCGTILTGRYCSECGQRHLHQPVHHFWHFVSEAVEDLTHADSRLWQTLRALLFRPGWLTREFLEGHRVRYLPPVRLYLVVSLIFFILVGLDSRVAQSYVVISYSGNSFHYQVVPHNPATRGAAAAARAAAPQAAGTATGVAALAPTAAARHRVCEQTAAYIEQHGGWLARFGPRAARSCLTTLGAGGLEHFDQVVEHNLERAMFLFLPLLALAMKPLYLRPPRHYVEHLLFFLHSHAFLFVMLGLGTLAGMITGPGALRSTVDLAIAVYVPIYFYRALRRVYGQGPWLTLGKLTALAVTYAFLGVVMLVATFSYSFLVL